MIQQAYRHGEIVFLEVDKIPTGLTKETTKTFLTGSNNNPHTFDNGNLYFKNENEFVFGYFKADNTTLFHLEHGDNQIGKLKEAKLPNGNYQLRKQVEFINGEMMPVKD